jgi:nicotinamidase/pyrazinamidase
MTTDTSTVIPLAPGKERRSLGKQLGLRHGDALLVIDVQRDFLPGGRLAIATGHQVIEPLNAYIAAFTDRGLPIFMTRDWHPVDHCSFREFGGKWPAHCVQQSPGAEWAEGLRVAAAAHVVSKAIDKNSEAYSGFTGTSLLAMLQALKVDRLFVGGLATDYCVHDTVIAARAHGFDVVILGDAIRGVNAAPGDESRALRDMLEAGATIFESSHSPSAEAHAAPAERRRDTTIGAYGFGTTLALPFTAAIGRVTQALHNEGFGIVSDVDIAATLHQKLGVDMPGYRILGACNPLLAKRALAAEPSLGLLLPCNVVVREDAEGAVHVEFLNPDVLATLVNTPAISTLAVEVRTKLRRALKWL